MIKLDYPRASFKSSLELAEAVDSLGGTTSIAICAEKMGKKVSGGFSALIGAATKFGMITNKKGQLSSTQLFKDMKLAYDEEAKIAQQRKMFLAVPLFNEVYHKYKMTKLPHTILEKVFVKEHNVEEKISGRVAGYFIDGSKYVGLLNDDFSFKEINAIPSNIAGVNPKKESPSDVRENTLSKHLDDSLTNSENFVVHIYGRGINSKIEIKESEDLDIITATLNKIKKSVAE